MHCCIVLLISIFILGCQHALPVAQVGTRPFYLVSLLSDGELKQRLEACEQHQFYRTDFSISHRGAPLAFAEHSRSSYLAAISMGAGVVECDVTFTADKQLVCRHAQCDLHQTTDILLRPALAEKCQQNFQPADTGSGELASAKCCTSDITLAEFEQLCAKMDGVNPQAIKVEDYIAGTPTWRTELYSQCAQPMTHAESIALFQQNGVKMIPELKQPEVTMPFGGNYTQQNFAQQLVDEYKAAGVVPQQVYLQSFNWQDILYWLKHEPEFGRQAVWLDGRYEQVGFDPMRKDSWQPSMTELKAAGLNIIAPPLWVLLTQKQGRIVPSEYAIAAKAAGLDIIAWSLERSPPLSQGPDWYYQSIPDLANNDGVVLQVLDVLARDIKVMGVFSDWPGTTSFYANCMLTN